MICEECGYELERIVIYTAEYGLLVVWKCHCEPTEEEEEEAIIDAEW